MWVFDHVGKINWVKRMETQKRKKEKKNSIGKDCVVGRSRGPELIASILREKLHI